MKVRRFAVLFFTVLAELCLACDACEQVPAGPEWMLPAGTGLGLLALLSALYDRPR